MPIYRFEWREETVSVVVEPMAGGYVVRLGETEWLVQADAGQAGELDLVWEDGRRLHAWLAAAGRQRWVALGSGAAAGAAFELGVPQPTSRRGRAGKGGGRQSLQAEMPSVVRRLLVAEGDQVARGQTLLILEAMKMEICVNAPEAGTVEAILVTEGQAVIRGQKLTELSASRPPQG